MVTLLGFISLEIKNMWEWRVKKRLHLPDHRNYNYPTAQSARIRGEFTAYSCDMTRQETARWRETGWCKDDAFQASTEGYSIWVRVCALWIAFYWLNLPQLSEVLPPIASVTTALWFTMCISIILPSCMLLLSYSFCNAQLWYRFIFSGSNQVRVCHLDSVYLHLLKRDTRCSFREWTATLICICLTFWVPVTRAHACCKHIKLQRFPFGCCPDPDPTLGLYPTFTQS